MQFDAPFEDVKQLACANELRKLFCRADAQPVKRLTGRQALIQLLGMTPTAKQYKQPLTPARARKQLIEMHYPRTGLTATRARKQLTEFLRQPAYGTADAVGLQSHEGR